MSLKWLKKDNLKSYIFCNCKITTNVFECDEAFLIWYVILWCSPNTWNYCTPVFHESKVVVGEVLNNYDIFNSGAVSGNMRKVMVAFFYLQWVFLLRPRHVRSYLNQEVCGHRHALFVHCLRIVLYEVEHDRSIDNGMFYGCNIPC